MSSPTLLRYLSRLRRLFFAPALHPLRVAAPLPLRRSRRAGFTLVEVTLAIGVVSFAFVGIFALLPAGLGIFRQAMDTSIGAQIAQRIVGEIEQTDFDALVPSSSGILSNVTQDKSGNFYNLKYRYFDDQGIEVNYETAAPRDQARILYSVRVRGSMPGNADPTLTSPNNFTSLPGTSSARYHPRNTTILTVQVITNPGRLTQLVLETMVNPVTDLIDPAAAKKNHLSIQTYSAVVARNGFRTRPS